ncbi:dienelactone hydrolase family protein [Simplicispira hankyongi]|jgi:pimeloyl-ACP methyl ester carboxylesterase|uniref:Alpha/beta hydrolase n=1 Tax=Simplicispira hankyongi TaxID=2315688 RepID=A0A398CAD9_9BURK|nr:alpha/beta family hydrolase [Simplicispira hankyongi]MBU6465087.1 dienelactone hydrolase family protein [Burkholderiales bacterium]RID97838.1 alpha/beta hydrolase [Simplicispira hankyongi]
MTVAIEPVVLQESSLQGDLAVPTQARALVLFAHGSGSSRLSERNRWVARMLQREGMATLLFDLLTPDEAQDRRKVFDVPLLGQRMEQAMQWASQRQDLGSLPLCLFGASTGAAAALVAAAKWPQAIAAVVCRGGRPDLAQGYLSRVQAPTLLIVGGDDTEVLELNRSALRQLRCAKRLEVVPGAGHLFEESGALESVAALAAEWFLGHLPTPE